MKQFRSLIIVVIILAAAVLGCNIFSSGWKASEACRYLEDSGMHTVEYTQKENRAYTCFEQGIIKNNDRITTHPGDQFYKPKPDEAVITYYAWGGFNSSKANSLKFSMHTGESSTAAEFQKDFLRLGEQLYQKAIGSPLPSDAKDFILRPIVYGESLKDEPKNPKVKDTRVNISKSGSKSVVNMEMEIYIPER